MTITPRRRRLKKRIETLPTAHDCGRVGIWIRHREKGWPVVKFGNLVCVVCGKP